LTTDKPKYFSELSEAELFRMWMKLREGLPTLYRKFMNPNYDDPDADENLRSVHAGVGIFIGKLLPDMPFHPDRGNVYRDMVTFADRYLMKGHKEEWHDADRNGK
jgi:hypothetical protein